MSKVGEWNKTTEKVPPPSVAPIYLVYTHAGEFKFCAFDGDNFYYVYDDDYLQQEQCCTFSAAGAPWWCLPEPPQP